MKKLFCLVLLLSSVGIGTSFAQSKNELGFLLGATLVPDQTITTGAVVNNNIKFSKGTTYQATYARQLFNAGIAGLYFELPFLATPNSDLTSSNPSPPTALASLFVTPGLRIKLLPGGGISPWASIGGGYGRFDEGSKLQNGSTNPGPKGTNTGVLQFGGGIDFNILSVLGLRGEVRDFYSGTPRLNVITQNSRQHNIVVSGGFVLHF